MIIFRVTKNWSSSLSFDLFRDNNLNLVSNISEFSWFKNITYSIEGFLNWKWLNICIVSIYQNIADCDTGLW